MASIVGEASSSPPPSTSIPPPRSCTYHVFLSFRGEDTHNGVAYHLCAALDRKGIKTFRDDKYLETGEAISVELLKAIEESMLAIIVLSPNYAFSSWCLDELHKIVECSKNMGLEVVPVFYGVELSDVRYQNGSFEEAFQKHEKRFGQNSDKVKGWKDALVQVANVSGFDCEYWPEEQLLEDIAEQIHKKLIKRLPSSTKNLVGIDSRVNEVISRIDIGLNDDVRSIGIWGMGGIGKTTIAEAVYDVIREEFKVSCFLANVREARENKQIVDKQKELLAQAYIRADNEHDIQEKIQTALRSTKVLLVLDDVSDEIELEKLAGKQEWFGPGSRIIITTRYAHLLTIYEVHETYEVQGLVNSESFDLFCLKAFKQKKPAKEYLDLSREVVEYSHGLPLVLEVWGSYLKGRPIDAWHEAIAQIKSTQIDEIHDKLLISYKGLDDKKKNIFLDIACFFKGKKRDYVTKVLKSCGYDNASIDIAILIERSLVKIDEKSNVFEMHDLLQDMGRSIVIQESPNNPDKRSRLWSEEDINLILANSKGSEVVQGIVLWLGRFGQHWSAEAFSNMTQLKLLIIESAGDLRGLSSLPTSLKVLRCGHYRVKTLPLADQQYELAEIYLTHSAIKQLWHGKKFLEKLTHLELIACFWLKQTPDLSEVPILRKLLLKSCYGLTEVHPSLVHHKSLTLLDLTECTRLEAIPGKLEMSSLNELILDECSSFENLPEFGECMESLSRLSLERTSIKKLPTSLGCLVGLKDLNLYKCKKLEYHPDIANGKLPSLRTLNLAFCHLTDESFPLDFGPFPSLMHLDLSGNSFVSMVIRELPKLKCLKLHCCRWLRCLPEVPSSIRELEARLCDSLDISEFNISSNVCGVFVSPSQDPGQVLLEMVISGSEIPSWFVHRQDGNSISSIPCDYPPNERLGIALCFQIRFEDGVPIDPCEVVLVVRNGNNRFNTNRIKKLSWAKNHLYIICLTNDHFGDGFHHGTCFELSILVDKWYLKHKIMSITSAARWVGIEDIKDL